MKKLWMKFEKSLNEKLRTFKLNNVFANEEDSQNQIRKHLSKLKNKFIEAHDLITEQWSRHNSDAGSKIWWTKKLTVLKKELLKARLEVKLWKDDDSIAKLNIA